jgi:hypothetical protein
MKKFILSLILFWFFSFYFFSQDSINEKYQLVIIDTNSFGLYNYYRFFKNDEKFDVICEKSKSTKECLKDLVIDHYYILKFNQNYSYMFLDKTSNDTIWIGLDIVGIGDTTNKISFGGGHGPVFTCDNLFGSKISCNIIEERKRFNFRKFKRQRIIIK